MLRRAAISISAAFIVTSGAAQVHAATQSPSSPALASSATPQSSQSSLTADQLFAELVKQNELRSSRLQKYSAQRTYSIADAKGKVHASETVRMEYVAPDKKNFVTISTEGSSILRYLVLDRLIASEVSTAAGQDHRDSSITPANYTFRLAGEETVGDRRCFVVEAVPKRPDKYLFEGKVWIDANEFAIVKIAGHPAKKLSFWVTRADFVRQYQKIGDFWLPARDDTVVEVKIYGKKTLSIEHHTESVNGVQSSEPTARLQP
jgi:hypothetical protein